MRPRRHRHRHRLRRAPALAALAALAAGASVALLAGCGGDDGGGGDGAADPSEAVATSTTEEPAGDGAVLPDHLPVDVPPGGRVDGVFEPAAGTLQDAYVARIVFPEGTHDDIVAFYDEHLADLGFTVSADLSGPSRWRWSWTMPDAAGATPASITLVPSDRFFDGDAVLEISWLPADG